jgi:outer membrane lipopolysaccharide assembly protein LptE/RlpB
MDKEFLVGCLSAVTALAIIVAGIVVGCGWHQQQQIQFEQICVSSHRNVVYENVNDNLVSECK